MPDIALPDGGTTSSGCSGVLISPQYIATAGHCFVDGKGNHITGAPYYQTFATIGKTDDSDTTGHVVEVVNVLQSPNNDIAIGQLKQPVTDVTPVLINHNSPSAGSQLILAGWGATTKSDNEIPETHLQYGSVTVTSVSQYEILVHGTTPYPDTSACDWDSGAPYFYGVGDKYGVLVALESDGPACPHSGNETTSRVDTVADWIDGIIYR
jgi:secreted trypsin-like serine protease